MAISSPLDAWKEPKYHTLPQPRHLRRLPQNVAGEPIQVILTRSDSINAVEIGYKSSLVEDTSLKADDANTSVSLEVRSAQDNINYMVACTKELPYSAKTSPAKHLSTIAESPGADNDGP